MQAPVHKPSVMTGQRLKVVFQSRACKLWGGPGPQRPGAEAGIMARQAKALLGLFPRAEAGIVAQVGLSLGGALFLEVAGRWLLGHLLLSLF